MPATTESRKSFCLNLTIWWFKLTSTSKEGGCDGNISQILFRVTRAVFAFAEMTNTDPGYSGPEFDFDKIIKDLMNKVREGQGTSLIKLTIKIKSGLSVGYYVASES